MKIYRYTNTPTQLNDCWQKSIASNCTLPCFNDDIRYILSELPKHEKKLWVFGFTKPQLIKACKTFKKQLKYCTDKSISQWSNKSKLQVFEVDNCNLYDFGDQVLFKH